MNPASIHGIEATPWTILNREYLDAHLSRLRLLLRRRVLWLRRQWKHDPLQDYQSWVISEDRADWLLAGEDQDEEAAFYGADPTARQIAISLAELEQRLQSRIQDMAAVGMAPALEVLVRLFGLTSFERDLIVLCLAPELDAGFWRLYAYTQDDMTRKFATGHLAVSLFATIPIDRLNARASFLPEAPLRRFRLLTAMGADSPAAGFSGCPLRLDERIVNYLLGFNHLDERLGAFLRATPAALVPQSHDELIDRLAGWVRSSAAHGAAKALNVVGQRDSGKMTVARAVCDRVGIALYALEAARLPPSGPERREILALLEREASLLNLAYFVDLDASSAEERQLLAGEVERLAVFPIVSTREPWPCAREMLTVHVSRPDAASQNVLWRQTLGVFGATLNGEVDAIVEQFDFGPASIARAVSAARELAAQRSPAEGSGVTGDDLWAACRLQVAPDLAELTQQILPCYGWEDLVVPDDIFRQLQEIAAQVAHRPRVYGAWGFGEKLSRGRGISVLFSGPSGVGKTMAAEVLAGHLSLNLYRIDLAGVVSKYIGETEKNLRKIFDAAERSGGILLFDEADALFGKRSEIKDSHDRYANIEINYLLQRMESYRGLAILTTNMRSLLDPAFLRRLRFVVDFPFPDAAHRLRIWQQVFPPRVPIGEVDYAMLSRLEIPGGNIRNIALNAAFLAASERAAVSTVHVLLAARREYAKIDKLMLESEFGSYYAVVAR